MIYHYCEVGDPEPLVVIGKRDGDGWRVYTGPYEAQAQCITTCPYCDATLEEEGRSDD